MSRARPLPPETYGEAIFNAGQVSALRRPGIETYLRTVMLRALEFGVCVPEMPKLKILPKELHDTVRAGLQLRSGFVASWLKGEHYYGRRHQFSTRPISMPIRWWRALRLIAKGEMDDAAARAAVYKIQISRQMLSAHARDVGRLRVKIRRDEKKAAVGLASHKSFGGI